MDGSCRFPHSVAAPSEWHIEASHDWLASACGSVSAATGTYSHSAQHLGRFPFSSLQSPVSSVYSIAQPGEDLRKSMSCYSLAVEFLPSTHKVMGSIPNTNKMMEGGGVVASVLSPSCPLFRADHSRHSTALHWFPSGLGSKAKPPHPT